MLSAAQTGASLMAQRSAARAQEQRQEQLTELSRRKQLLRLTSTAAEERRATIQDVFDTEKAQKIAQRNIGEIRAQAASRGVTGTAVALSIDEANRDYLEYRAAKDMGAKFREEGRMLGGMSDALYSQAEMRNINKEIAQPNYVAGMLDLGGAYSTYKKNQADLDQYGDNADLVDHA